VFFFFFWGGTAFVLILLKNFCSVPLPISLLGHWFFQRLVFWASCKFLLLFPIHRYSWQRFFSHSVGCHFYLVPMSFVVQKLFKVIVQPTRTLISPGNTLTIYPNNALSDFKCLLNMKQTPCIQLKMHEFLPQIQFSTLFYNCFFKAGITVCKISALKILIFQDCGI
jgi:hypothetical protein